MLTNGLYTPALHRVLNTDRKPLIPFFSEPAFEATIAPLPAPAELLAAAACGAAAGGGARAAARFPSVRYSSHLESKMLSNFEL
jgi:isopenicillin N synthase-like dioxygenase